MKRYIALAALLLAAAFTLPDTPASSHATCVGADPCRACKNCHYCKRCAQNGLTCGVCKPKKKP